MQNEQHSAGRVLIVDDNEMNREVLQRRLERQGYSVDAAEDGQRALEMLQGRGPGYDLLLLDIMMPRMNGYQVLEAMQTDPTLRALPVIVISAVDELDSIVRCIELGAQDYLFKPFNPVLLKARITAVMSRRDLIPNQKIVQAEVEAAAKALDNVIALSGLPDLASEQAKTARAHLDKVLDTIRPQADPNATA
jgi:DNA-binding response OmpR family regulator